MTTSSVLRPAIQSAIRSPDRPVTVAVRSEARLEALKKVSTGGFAAFPT
jgi:hypothetical protein